MSIESEINRISANVSDTLSAISEMGGTVSEGATSDDMAAGVRSIPVGATIDDTTASTSTTYSSSKIDTELNTLNEANAQQDTEIAKKANDSDLAVVAKSGSYNDLTGKPTIPAAYTLPIASATQLGGVKPVAKTDEMTQSVGVDEAGGLWAMAGGGGAVYTEMELCNFTSTEEAATINVELSSDAKNFLKTCDEIYLTLIPGVPSSATERANAKITVFGNYTNSLIFLDTTSGVLPTSEQSSDGRDIVLQRIDCVIRVYGRMSYSNVNGAKYRGCCNGFAVVRYPTANGNYAATNSTTKMVAYGNMYIKDILTTAAQYIRATSTNGVFGIGTEIRAWARRYNA